MTACDVKFCPSPATWHRAQSCRVSGQQVPRHPLVRCRFAQPHLRGNQLEAAELPLLLLLDEVVNLGVVILERHVQRPVLAVGGRAAAERAMAPVQTRGNASATVSVGRAWRATGRHWEGRGPRTKGATAAIVDAGARQRPGEKKRAKKAMTSIVDTSSL